MCDFHEPFFGATYPDACCIDGYLWDEDSCDEPGGGLISGGDFPCPQCNHEEWVARAQDHFENLGAEACCNGKPKEYKHEPIQFEQPGDALKFRQWWEAGWDWQAVQHEQAHP